LRRGLPAGRLAADLAGRLVAGRFAARFAGAGAAFRAAVFFFAALFCAVFRFGGFGVGVAVDFRAFAVVPRFAAPREGFAADGVFLRRGEAAAEGVGATGVDGCTGFAARGFVGFGFGRVGFPEADAGAAGLAGGAVPLSSVPAPSWAGSSIDDQSASLWDWSVGGSTMLANRQRSRNLMSFSS
jgi:hypothetical protein